MTQQNTLHARKWSLHNGDLLPDRKVRMRLCAAGTKTLSECCDEVVTDRIMQGSRAQHLHHAGGGQHADSVCGCEANEAVAGKERSFQKHLAVFPTTHRLVDRQETFHATRSEGVHGGSFVVAPGMHGIPSRDACSIQNRHGVAHISLEISPSGSVAH